MAVEFHEASYEPQRQATRVPALARLVIRMGLAKDERGATLVLVGVIILCLAVIAGIWISASLKGGSAEPPLEPVTRASAYRYG